jgi:type IV secretory pathway VirB10-like protein
VNVGGYQGVRAQSSGVRAAVNAQLEEISFRTGLIGAAIALAALLAIAAAGVYAATVSHGSPAANTTSVRSVASAPAKLPTAPTAAASVPPSTPAHPSASLKPKAQPTAPTAGAPPQSAAAPQPQTPASSAGSQSQRLGSRDYGHTNPRGYGPWSGGHHSRHSNFGFPGPFGRMP